MATGEGPPRATSGSISIREPCLPEDGDRIAGLYEETARWHAGRWPQDMRALDAATLRPEVLELANPDKTRCVLVAELDGDVVGLITASVTPAPAGGLNHYRGPIVRIADVVVTESARRRGIADRLMARVEQWARDVGAATVTLSVHAGNQPAEALYDRRGYRATDVTMRKDL